MRAGVARRLRCCWCHAVGEGSVVGGGVACKGGLPPPSRHDHGLLAGLGQDHVIALKVGCLAELAQAKVLVVRVLGEGGRGEGGGGARGGECGVFGAEQHRLPRPVEPGKGTKRAPPHAEGNPARAKAPRVRHQAHTPGPRTPEGAASPPRMPCGHLEAPHEVKLRRPAQQLLRLVDGRKEVLVAHREGLGNRAVGSRGGEL